MGDLNVQVEVRNKDIVDDIRDAIENGIRRGSGQASSNGISDEMEDAAQAKIREEGAIWKRELVNAFKSKHQKAGGNMTITLQNVSDHAGPLEYGVEPGEYGEQGPPILPLIAWLMTKGANLDPPDDEIPDTETMRDELPNERLVNGDGENIDIFLQFPKPFVDQAFWLQQHIKETGLDAVRFMEAAEQWAEANADRTIAKYISAELEGL